jgi:hypothetical protein
MKGRIYPNRDGYVVRFGRRISKWFKHKNQAERFLTGIRYEIDKGTFDPRDYDSARPLAFKNQAKAYLKMKRKKVKPSSYRNIKNYIGKAIAAWDMTNIKAIGYAQIEDLLAAQDVSDKTRADMCSALHAFWGWVCKREEIDKVPSFPVITYELGWRNIIDLETQQAIIDKVGKYPRISARRSHSASAGLPVT